MNYRWAHGNIRKWMFGLLAFSVWGGIRQANAAVSQAELDGLETFYWNTRGPAWIMNTNWLATSPNPPCDWYGVTCDNPDLPTAIRDLALHSNNLRGSITSELAQLSELEYLALYNNQLEGKLPSELGSLTKLKFFYLDVNQLSGPIPAELGNLTNLFHFAVYDNELSGEIPSELGMLINLTSLRLENNRLSGSIPSELGNLTNLNILYLHGNNLNGSVPAQLKQLTSTLAIFLEWNALYTDDDVLQAFLEEKGLLEPGTFHATQTLDPTGVIVDGVGTDFVSLRWQPRNTIPPTEGGYRVYGAQTGDEQLQLLAQVENKSSSDVQVRGLLPQTTYTLQVRSYTLAHDSLNEPGLVYNKNEVESRGNPEGGSFVEVMTLEQVVETTGEDSETTSTLDTDGPNESTETSGDSFGGAEDDDGCGCHASANRAISPLEIFALSFGVGFLLLFSRRRIQG